jgi:hypothetical protein
LRQNRQPTTVKPRSNLCSRPPPTQTQTEEKKKKKKKKTEQRNFEQTVQSSTILAFTHDSLETLKFEKKFFFFLPFFGFFGFG